MQYNFIPLYNKMIDEILNITKEEEKVDEAVIVDYILGVI